MYANTLLWDRKSAPMGNYCKLCGQRCFVSRVMPDDSRWRPGETAHLATCEKGMAQDFKATGYTSLTALNPPLVAAG